MKFHWNSNYFQNIENPFIHFNDYEELLDILEYHFGRGIMSFEVLSDDESPIFSHRVLIRLKNHERVTRSKKPIVVGHLKISDIQDGSIRENDLKTVT